MTTKIDPTPEDPLRAKARNVIDGHKQKDGACSECAMLWPCHAFTLAYDILHPLAAPPVEVGEHCDCCPGYNHAGLPCRRSAAPALDVERLRAALHSEWPECRHYNQYPKTWDCYKRAQQIIEADAALEGAPALDGTETNCPLEGVHEHPFRGPHRFREWEPGT